MDEFNLSPAPAATRRAQCCEKHRLSVRSHLQGNEQVCETRSAEESPSESPPEPTPVSAQKETVGAYLAEDIQMLFTYTRVPHEPVQFSGDAASLGSGTDDVENAIVGWRFSFPNMAGEAMWRRAQWGLVHQIWMLFWNRDTGHVTPPFPIGDAFIVEKPERFGNLAHLNVPVLGSMR